MDGFSSIWGHLRTGIATRQVLLIYFCSTSSIHLYLNLWVFLLTFGQCHSGNITFKDAQVERSSNVKHLPPDESDIEHSSKSTRCGPVIQIKIHIEYETNYIHSHIHSLGYLCVMLWMCYATEGKCYRVNFCQ